MTYREHVHRVLSKHHARIELGLAKSREQKRFAEYIAQFLRQRQIPFCFDLNDDFDAIFDLPQFSGCLKTLFSHFWVEADGTQWIVCNPNAPEIQVILRKGLPCT